MSTATSTAASSAPTLALQPEDIDLARAAPKPLLSEEVKGPTWIAARERRRSPRASWPDSLKLPSFVRYEVIRDPEKATYPLRHPISLRVASGFAGISIEPLGSEIRDLVAGRGPTLEAARDDFGRRFDRLIQENRVIPPHARTAENERIARILGHLVDWERYEEENPLIQPMWGQVRERLADGSLRIHWVIGRNGLSDQEDILRSQDVHPRLADIPIGRWFYGTARSFRDHVSWVDPPGDAPDPENPAARLEVWESLPIEYANEPGCWPVLE